MTKEQIKEIFDAWKQANNIYSKYYPEKHLSLPDPLQKDIIILHYDDKLKKSSEKTYDFEGNVELKSSTNNCGGCTPFKSRQKDCKRIIYMEISGKIAVYEIARNDVNKINEEIDKKGQNVANVNISLKDYIKTLTPTILEL